MAICVDVLIPNPHALPPCPVAARCFLSKLCVEMGYRRDPNEAPPPGGQKISSWCTTTLLYPFLWQHRDEKTIFFHGGGRGAFCKTHGGANTLMHGQAQGHKMAGTWGTKSVFGQGLLGQLILFVLNTSLWHTRREGFAVVTLYCGKVCYFFFSVLQIAFLKAFEKTWERKDQLISEILFRAQSSKLLLNLGTASPTAKIQGASVEYKLK